MTYDANSMKSRACATEIATEIPQRRGSKISKELLESAKGPPDEAAFNRALNERVAKLRIDAGMTQAQVAAALGIHVHAYQHFEYRSPMPAYLIPTFAAVVGADVRYVLTGEGHLRNAA
jgi:DNA-binding XRE family transcriptional regulator